MPARTSFRQRSSRKSEPCASHREPSILSANVEQLSANVQQLLSLAQSPSDRDREWLDEARSTERLIQIESDESDAQGSEGASSFYAQALVVCEALRTQSDGHRQPEAAQEGVRLLVGLLSPRPGNTVPEADLERPWPPSRTIQLPPIHIVLQLLQEFKLQQPMSMLVYALPGIEYLEQLCRAAYFPTELLSPGLQATMHGLLLLLLQECQARQNTRFPGSVDYGAVLQVCETNFCTGSRTYEVLARATYEHVLSLYLAAIFARESFNTKRAWTYVCTAAKHLLHLGYHRGSTISSLSAGTARDSLILFRNVHALDKSLALALDHTATMQDDDIDAPLIQPCAADRLRPWQQAVNFRSRLAYIEGQNYRPLYTVAARKARLEHLTATVRELSIALEQCVSLNRPRRTANCTYGDYFDFIYEDGLNVAYHSLRTKIHYSVLAGSDDIPPLCYDAAVRCLETHLNALTRIRQHRRGQLLQKYLALALQYAASTPPIVVFRHAVSSADTYGLILLQKFYNSLNDIQDPSEELQKLQRTCEILIIISTAYIASREAIATTKAVPSTAPDPGLTAYGHTTQAFRRWQAMGNCNQSLHDAGLSYATVEELFHFTNDGTHGAGRTFEHFDTVPVSLSGDQVSSGHPA